MKIIKELNEKKGLVDKYKDLKSRYENIEIIIDFIKSGDESFENELNNEIQVIIDLIEQYKITILLNEKYDNNNAIITINSGAGGVESFDFVSMLYQMYEKWANKHKYKIKILDYLQADEVGFKNITFSIDGEYIYGLLKSEKGVHRLIRISPYDSNKRRHTTFAAVNVVPDLEQEINIEINSSDVEIDTYRASGAGGQHVNTTNSAVRIKHIKTGIVVTCQNERSQIQNRETAMKILKSKLIELEIENNNKVLQNIKGKEEKIEWGSQIRSYIMQPYELVKDHRTKYEETNVENVLNGQIDEFIKSYLKMDK